MPLKHVNIYFSDLTFSKKNKCLLNGLTGQFIGGQLSGILGPSGAGKTTLLNILAGQIQHEVSGDIFINNKPKNAKVFHRISSYIMQDDVLQPRLSVMEMMITAANLKLESHYREKEKYDVICNVLTSMGLQDCSETRTEHLSGGQRKRLCIALELVNNPPVIFLDEPTSGLDDVSTKQCMTLLKSLAKEGKTIICTIHQPSNTVFELFDRVYFLSEGNCIYSGPTQDIVPFLSEAGMPCPEIYNPADFLIELAHVEKWAHALKINNEKFVRIPAQNHEEEYINQYYDDSIGYICAVSFWMQFWILVKRKSLQIIRNRFTLVCEFGHHIICGAAVGLTFQDRGESAKYLVDNLKLYYGIIIYFMFAHGMSIALTFPVEVKLIQREYFNRWYSLKAYFLALNLSMLPVSCIGATIFTILVYGLTRQPLDIDRMVSFLLVVYLFVIATQGFGLVIGAIFSPTNGACIGSAIGMALLLLASYNMGAGETTNLFMKTLMTMSYAYHGYTGFTITTLKNREMLDCEEIFCYYTDPQVLVQAAGMEHSTMDQVAMYLVMFAVLHRLLTYGFLKYRLQPDSKLYAML